MRISSNANLKLCESQAMFFELHEWAVASRNIKAETRFAKADAMMISVSSRVKFPYEVFSFLKN